MILKNKSFYRKFVDWWDNFVKDKPLITASANDVIFLICFFTLLILLFLFRTLTLFFYLSQYTKITFQE